MKTRRSPILAFAVLSVLTLAPSARAQDSFDMENTRLRLNRIEKQVGEIRNIVFQARDTGKPVEIREAGPDPQVTALQAKVDDLDQTLRGLTGQIESLSHDLDMARRQAASQNAALADRVDKLEKQLAGMTPQPSPTPLAGGAAGAAPSDAGPAPDGGPKAVYAKARQLMLDGDYAAAATAFQDYVDRYGEGPGAPVARYWLGQTKYIQGDYAGAATAFIGAIRGWPQSSWAPEAVVKLSLSLVQLNKAPDACRTLAEFQRHYPHAPAADKAHANVARVKAGCAG